MEEMEPLAENRFTITKTLFYEGMLRLNRESYGAFSKKIVAVLAILWVVLAAVTFGNGGSMGFVVTELIVLILVVIWLCVWMPRSKAGRAWKALEARCGSDLERTTRFYDTWLEINSNEDEIAIFYDEVRQILPSEHLLVLTCENKVGVLLARDSFTIGSAEEVQALIQGSQNANKQ